MGPFRPRRDPSGAIDLNGPRGKVRGEISVLFLGRRVVVDFLLLGLNDSGRVKVGTSYIPTMYNLKRT